MICALVSPDGERSMAADRGTARDLRADDVEQAWLAGADHLHVSGYALMCEPVRTAALRAGDLARAQAARVSVDLASWSAIRDSGLDAFREAVRTLRPEVVFANEDEERVVGRAGLDATWILKRGANGCSFGGDERAALPVERVVDTTGAGDALAAGWIVGGPDLALEAAAQCVQQVGAMP
jgi:sugar/nucleoside kinase (ribokinase family)